MKYAVFYGAIKQGKLELENPDKATSFCEGFEEDTPIKVTIEKQYKDKTQDQLGYYFGAVVRRCSEVSGYTEAEIDGIFCKAALTQNKGTSREYVKSKALCNTVEINHLIDVGRNIGACQWGVVVEDPDKNWKEKA